ncbi:hypothetical protein [Methylobacterium sp. WSM2598]|uniref:hypothetical protein n=1 Tax=Methylobacterium sp. WSM2598 TaxID=398261 RepID=UPI00035DC6C8|nr:hypothetical protein [Methylobacterium sp. WSM2598]
MGTRFFKRRATEPLSAEQINSLDLIEEAAKEDLSFDELDEVAAGFGFAAPPEAQDPSATASPNFGGQGPRRG